MIEPMRLGPGDKFDRYTIEEMLGKGGMGVVYRAFDQKLERRVALKVLQSSRGDADTWGRAVARMLREARAAAALSHPNAVGIYDVGEHDGTPYLAMELIEGSPLRHRIGADIPLPTRLRWLGDIARALSAAHRAGLVHRDVKPENILLRSDGVVKVLDFGIARSLRLSSEREREGVPRPISTVTEQGTLVGTPAYMAPEQIRGDSLDGRADQFSWGVLAYELLSGKLPFGAGRDAVGMLASVLTEKEPPLTGVPEGVASIVHRALAKEPEGRFASMDDVFEALVVASGGAVEADPGPSSGPRSTARRIHITPVDQPRSPSLSSTGGSGATIVAPSPSRRPRWPFVAAAAGVLAIAALLVSSRRAEAPSQAPPSLPSPAAPVPTPVTELALPKTQSPEALAAYREGLQAFRDASWPVADEAFKRAVKLDPSFAAAYLRLAMTNRYLGTSVETREAFQKAMQLRSSLGERDQVVLDALEPQLFREPSDVREASRRFEAAAARFPGDAEILSLQNSVDPTQPPATELELADRCVALDPLYADCWQVRGFALRRMRRNAEAIAAFDQCLTVSPVAHDCLRDRAASFAETGKCEALEADARSLIARLPKMSVGFDFLALSLFARGRPIAAVRSAMEQAHSRKPESAREIARLGDEGQLALAAGRFGEAEKLTLELAKKLETDPSEEVHTTTAMTLIQIYEETGRLKEAGKVAAATLQKLDGLVKQVEASILLDKTVALLDASYRGGLLSQEELEAGRSSWLREVEKKYPATAPGVEWFVAYAKPAKTVEEAKAALGRIPEPRVVAPFVPGQFGWSAVMGRLYWLTGRHAEALPYLREVVSDCRALEAPFRTQQASYQLGEVLAATGDKEGACGALRVVLDRWGSAKESVTVKAAAGRWKALGCGK
jgi:serine/threonine-protein kinase